jgi:hypothetical protein
MSDQQAPPVADTPAVAGPDQAPGTAQEQPEVNWEKRYQDLQPEYTRTTQQLREYEERNRLYDLAMTAEDEDTRRQALEALGYEIPEAEDPEPAEYEDPYEELRSRQERLEQQFQQDQQATREQIEGQLISELATERLTALGVPEADHDLVLAYAINALPPKQQPPGSPVRVLPDVEGAVEFFQAREAERQKEWAKTKRAPYVASGGSDATQAPQLPPDANHEQRMEYAKRRLMEMESPQ